MGRDDDTDTDTTVAERGVVALQSSGRISNERYEIGAMLGHGGMGEVVVARDAQIGRDVAIKRIRVEDPSDRMIARFLREAQIQGRLEHPSIPPVHELGRDPRGRPYFVMKKLAGTTLSDLLQEPRGTHPLQRLLRAFADVCLAIEFAHVHGVVHRDIKPSNIMLGEFGEVYVLDWGVAKVIGDDDSFDDMRSDGPHTKVGAAVGTPGYMAPEQSAGVADIDARADVYALGCVLGKILEHDLQPPPPELEELLRIAITGERDKRTITARELGARVQQYLDGDRDLERRRILAREHLAMARTALDGGKDEARGVAMLSAGRALAMDPTLTEAAEIVAGLLIEPPSIAPPEVVRAVETDVYNHIRSWAQFGVWSVAAYLLLVPSLVTGATPVQLCVYGLIVASQIAMEWSAARGSFVPFAMRLGVSAAQIAILSVLYTPLPTMGVAAFVAMRLTLMNFHKSAREHVLIAVTIVVAVLGPLLLSWVGWTDNTLRVDSNEIALNMTGITSYAGLVAFLILTSITMVSVGVMIARRNQLTQVSSARLLHMQSWHLRHLVPRGP